MTLMKNTKIANIHLSKQENQLKYTFSLNIYFNWRIYIVEDMCGTKEKLKRDEEKWKAKNTVSMIILTVFLTNEFSYQNEFKSSPKQIHTQKKYVHTHTPTHSLHLRVNSRFE